jgi:predicted phage tail protein
LRGFNEIRIEQSIGTKVTKDIGPVVATTSSSELDRLNVRVGVASLFQVEDDGDVKGTEVEFNIQIFASTDENQPIIDQNKKLRANLAVHMMLSTTSICLALVRGQSR